MSRLKTIIREAERFQTINKSDIPLIVDALKSTDSYSVEKEKTICEICELLDDINVEHLELIFKSLSLIKSEYTFVIERLIELKKINLTIFDEE